MMRSLNTAASGMVAQQTRIDVIANNMANVGTVGFRRARAEFQDLLYQQVRTPGALQNNGNPVPTGVQLGQGTRTVSTEFMHVQGTLQQTGNALDLAIEGAGFFQVMRPNGEVSYSRAGNFRVGPNGDLMTVDGLMVEPSVQIPVDATGITISPDGTISVTQPSSAEAQQVGQLQVARFVNPGGLEALGRGLFRATAASGQPFISPPGQEGSGTLAQGFLEGSNVEVVHEMIDLISSQRAYELNQRVIQASDEMLRKATDV
jgi:flagellar basal-body rod protein FlgG